ncbi:MAG TPA: hypothetical protein VF116_06865 [Ktedonobacterales bacterium]
MTSKQVRGGLLGALVATLLLMVAACGMTPASPAAGASGTPGATGTQQFVNCAQLPEMKGARQTVEIPSIDFPATGAAIVTVTSPASAPMQVVRYVACMQVFTKGSVGPGISVPVVSNTSSPTAEVIEVLNLVNRGWVQGAFFPFDGSQLRPCSTAQLCFALDPQDFVELEQIANHSHGVLTFVLRVASAQPLLACDPALFPVDTFASSYSITNNATIPLPPNTIKSTNYEDAVGITTYFCTGGTVASIQAFMAQHLPASGWSSLTFNGVQIWKSPSGTGPFCIRVNPITDARKWSILYYVSCPDLG